MQRRLVPFYARREGPVSECGHPGFVYGHLPKPQRPAQLPAGVDALLFIRSKMDSEVLTQMFQIDLGGRLR